MFPDLPEIFVPASEKRHLFAAANVASTGRLSIANFLQAELRRARFCSGTAFPSDTVVMNRSLTYRIDWGPESPPCRIVYPNEFSGSDIEISLFSRLGVALLGLRIGDRMPFFTPEHGFRLLSVVSVGEPDAIEPTPPPARQEDAGGDLDDLPMHCRRSRPSAPLLLQQNGRGQAEGPFANRDRRMTEICSTILENYFTAF